MDTGAVITLDEAPDGNGFSTDSEVAGWGFGVQQKENGVNTDLYAYVDTNGFHAETITANSTHLSGDSLTFDNGSKLKKGTTDAGIGGNGGIALKCSVDYELKWDAGRLYTMEQDGFTIRRVDRCRNIAPTATDDSTKGFVIGSLWVLDDGTSYECTSSTEGNAVWVEQAIGSNITTSTGTNLSGFISGNGTNISGATAGSVNTTGNTIALRDSDGRLQSTMIRLKAANDTHYTQINASNNTESVSFQFPLESATIATNKTAVMLSGDQTDIAGNKSFSGQMELTGQAATNPTSALTRALGDSRYENKSYVGIKVENVDSFNNTPIKLTSVTLPIGTYHLETHIAGFANNTPNGSLKFGLRSNQNIRTSLASYVSRDSETVNMGHVTSDSLTYSEQLVLGTTGSRNLNGIIEIIINNTEVSIEFSQMTTFPSLASTSRKRSYIIARKIA
jgi:hypothetical protein